MILNKWEIPDLNKSRKEIIELDYNLNNIIASILVNRNIDDNINMDTFYIEEYKYESPFCIADMEIAVSRIYRAIKDEEIIAIYGDYDCDGVTSSSMLYLYLKSIGANVIYYIPSRSGEGYGLNCQAIKTLKDNNIDLIITVDNGITAVNEASFAKAEGIDLIISDHHKVPDIVPDAYAIVNPHRKDCLSEFKHICGAGVAFKIIVAMEDGDYDGVFEEYGDILAIGTVGDVVPLILDNRFFVKKGIEILKKTTNIGIIALCEVIGIDLKAITSEVIAFNIVPRINAAGRMGKATLAVELLICDDYDDALKLAKNLDNLNIERKETEKNILKKIDEKIENMIDISKTKVIVLYDKDWHHGVIGIVCSRIVEKYGKPTIVLSIEGEFATGSGRSVGDFSLFDALMSCRECFERFGGHKYAVGMTISVERIDEFIEKINLYVDKNFDIIPLPSYKIDYCLKSGDLTIDNIYSLDFLKPFGNQNPDPIFLLDNAIIENIIPLKDDSHIKVIVNFHGELYTCLRFNCSQYQFFYKKGDKIDIIGNIDINEYKGNRSISIKIKDYRYSDFDQTSYIDDLTLYENFKLKKLCSIDSCYIPTKSDISYIYKFIKYNKLFDYHIDYLMFIFKNKDINYFKIRIIIDILLEVNLIQLKETLIGLSIIDNPIKVDLKNTKIFKNLLNLGGENIDY
ncbi:MAG: single-stranded-DNA-specific exonuclease RecJ [Oscillospiraceae bacterium]|nr:single-stranded-DNA-specific exonuclease RecJ [Oscillospiraceae bacterium]